MNTPDEASAAFAEMFPHFTATAALTPHEPRKSIYGYGPMLPRYFRSSVKALYSKLN